LLKLARQDNLAPAQLEKMAQIYNTAKNLTFMSKSAQRGGSFSIIDTEDLLAQFTDYTPLRKAAAWSPEPFSKAAGDADSWFDAPAEEPSDFSRFPDVELLEMRTAVKAAAEALPVVETEHDKFAAECVARRNYLTLQQVQDDNREIVYNGFKKLADILRDRDIDFHEVEDDMLSLMGSDVRSTFDVFKNFNPRYAGEEKRASRAMAYDRHDVQALVQEIHDALELFNGASDLLKDAATRVWPPAAGKDHATISFKPDPAPAPPGKHKHHGGGGSGGGMGRPQRNAPIPPSLQAQPQQSGQGGGTKPPVIQVNTGADKSQDGGSKEQSKDKDSPLLGAIDSYIESGRKMTPVRSLHGGIKEILGEAKGRNKDQEMVDRSADDTIHQALLQRLIITDPVLSEADPGQVVDLANSIRSANPSAAKDVNFMRAQLREALQYGALPQHTYKDLIAMRKDLAQAQNAERGNADNEYAGVPVRSK
jgi:hypothetical protein